MQYIIDREKKRASAEPTLENEDWALDGEKSAVMSTNRCDTPLKHMFSAVDSPVIKIKFDKPCPKIESKSFVSRNYDKNK